MTKKIDILRNLTDEELVDICDSFSSASDYLRSVDIPQNGRHISLINARREELDLEWQEPKNKVALQTCPVCSKKFKRTASASRGQTTCSVGCANTYFRSGVNNHNYSNGSASYRTRCFAVREHACIICGEDKIVEVHHYDEDHSNNDINNLVPLCPNHHQYFHSKWRYLVEPQINQWRHTNMLP